MLFKLSLKNMKKSMKDYAIYFFTLILGVSVFYVFNSMETQTVFLNVSNSTRDIIQLMISMLSGVSVFVSIVLGFLIIYANQFLMKRRKKEFGIYMTLGMSKGNISRILLIETLLIGIISLVVGLFLGVGLSQLMSVFVANMFEADLSKFSFVFSKAAMIKTILYFGIMYFLVMIFNTISVGKCKLIELLHANKKNEQIKMKNPFLVAFVFLLSVVILGYSYYRVTIGATTIQMDELMVVILLGGIGTFLLFWSMSGMLLRIFMSFKKTYYKNLNMFVLRQVSSKVNTTVFSMSIISIMLFLTIGILSSALSLKNSMTSNLKKLAPIDFEAMKYVDTTLDNRGLYTEEQIADATIPITETLKRMDIDIDDTFVDTLEFSVYHVPGITLRVSIGEEINKITEQYRFLNVDSKEAFMKISDYNRVAKQLGMPSYQLKDNQYMIIADFDSMMSVRNPSLKKKTPLSINGKTYTPKYDVCKDGFIEISSNHINTGIILVPDDALTEEMVAKNYFTANYRETTEEGKAKVEEAFIEKTENHPYKDSTRLNGMTKIAIYTASVGLGAMATFIGIYLGIIFLISSAAILALKELSESSDNKDRYQILRRIGTDEKMIRHALFAQIAVFFLVPLFVAIIHSVFGIQFANQILETFGNEHLLPSIVMTATFLIAIYGGYFIITYLCSKNIISEK